VLPSEEDKGENNIEQATIYGKNDCKLFLWNV
jgi:hypothetical protein